MVSLGFVVLAMIEFAIILLWSRAPGTYVKIGKKVFRRRTSVLSSEKIESNTNPCGIPLMPFLDVVSFWTFFAFYAIFNCVYWIHFY